MSNPEAAIAAVRDGTSLLWAFYDAPDEPGREQEIEVRLNAMAEAVSAFVPPVGWAVNRIQWSDTLFLRRRQALDRGSVEEMLVEMLQFAAARDLQFHSWLQWPGLDDD